MQTNWVRKTGAVFFGGREIIWGNVTKSTRSIIETRSILLHLKQAALLKITSNFLLTRNNQKHHKKYF